MQERDLPPMSGLVVTENSRSPVTELRMLTFLLALYPTSVAMNSVKQPG